MRTMIDLGRHHGRVLQIINTPTAVDCGGELRLRRHRRSLVDCMLPFCFSSSSEDDDQNDVTSVSSSSTSSSCSSAGPELYSPSRNGLVSETFFGNRRGRVSLFLRQYEAGKPTSAAVSSSSHLILLELPILTVALAREMDNGLVRIALESSRRRNSEPVECGTGGGGSIFEVPVWTVYCNGRKVGYAVRRHVTGNDAAVLSMMRSVSVGAGVLPAPADGGNACGDDVLYMRARFERVTGSCDSESFHMINRNGSFGQHLSIFMLRS